VSKGELLLALHPSNAAQAEKSFRTAVEIARKLIHNVYRMAVEKRAHVGDRYIE